MCQSEVGHQQPCQAAVHAQHHTPQEIFKFGVWQPPSTKHYLTGVYSPRQIPSTEHGTGEQVLAQGTPTRLLAEQGHPRLHHHIGCWPLCQATHPLWGSLCPDTSPLFCTPIPWLSAPALETALRGKPHTLQVLGWHLPS